MPRRRCSTSYVARTGASPEAQPYRGQRLHLVTGAERFGAEDQLVRQELDQPEVIDERHHPADAATERASVPARALDEPGMAGRDEACAEHQHHEHQSSSNRRHHACLSPVVPAGPRGPHHAPDHLDESDGPDGRGGPHFVMCRISPIFRAFLPRYAGEVA
jgi:hypothetical protein